MDNAALKAKAETLADRMNKITQKLDLSEELIIQGDDIIECVEEKTQDIDLYSNPNYADIMNLKVMTDDFKYVRETLKEITNNARRVQSSITLDLLDSDDDKRASLVMSFSELSRSITEAQKLYVYSYNVMSNTLLNLDKIRKNEKTNPSTINNTVNNLNINSDDPISTVDLIKKLSTEKNKE